MPYQEVGGRHKAGHYTATGGDKHNRAVINTIGWG